MASRSSGGRGKLFHKIKDVCELTNTEPYVLRYWEQEFPFLAPEKNKAGHRIYTDADVELVRRIKKLLYDEGYTTAGARRQLERELTEAEAPEKQAAQADAGTPAHREFAELEQLKKENAAYAEQVARLAADREGLASSLRALQARVLDLRQLVASAGPRHTGTPRTGVASELRSSATPGTTAKGESSAELAKDAAPKASKAAAKGRASAASKNTAASKTLKQAKTTKGTKRAGASKKKG